MATAIDANIPATNTYRAPFEIRQTLPSNDIRAHKVAEELHKHLRIFLVDKKDSSFANILALCDQQRYPTHNPFEPWNGTSQTHPFTNPELHSKILNDKPLYEAMIHSTGRDVREWNTIQELLRLMQISMLNQFYNPKPDLGISKSDALGVLYKIHKDVASNQKRGDKDTSETVNIFLATFGYADWAVRGATARELNQWELVAPAINTAFAGLASQEIRGLLDAAKSDPKLAGKNSRRICDVVHFIQSLPHKTPALAAQTMAPITATLVDRLTSGSKPEAKLALGLLKSLRLPIPTEAQNHIARQ